MRLSVRMGMLLTFAMLAFSGCFFTGAKSRDIKADQKLNQVQNKPITEKDASDYEEVQPGFPQEPKESQAS